MAEQALLVAEDRMVSLSYVLRLDDGVTLERSESQEPLQFIQGRGQIIPGLENALYGMQAGEEKSIVVNPSDGYGEYDDDNLDVMPRNAFPADLDLTVGMGLRLKDDKTGEVYTGYVAELDEEKAIIDFNHPLAGETLYFKVQVIGVRMATAEELT